MSGKPRIPALLLQNLMLGLPSTHKLSAKRSFLKTQECQWSLSLHLIKTLSPTKLGQRHSSFIIPAPERPRGGQGQSRFNRISTAVCKPFLALGNRKQEMSSLRSSPHCPALLSQFLLVRPPTFLTLPFYHPPQSSSILTGLHICTAPSEIAGNCWGPTCRELLKQGASTFKRIKL